MRGTDIIKQVVDGIPNGSYIDIPKDRKAIVGIKWKNNEYGVTDLDLSVSTENGKIRWDAKKEYDGIEFSGDVVNAPELDSEVIAIGKTSSEMIRVDMSGFSVGGEVTYMFYVGTIPIDAHVKSEEDVEILYSTRRNITDGVTDRLGVFMDGRFYFYQARLGKTVTTNDIDLTKEEIDMFRRKNISQPFLSEINKKRNKMKIELDGGEGYCEIHDFSRTNTTQEARIEAITKVASICYKSETALGSKVLYNRLVRESAGLPSSSFEFVPVLLDRKNITHELLLADIELPTVKYGEAVNDRYWLTNYRAIFNTHAIVGEINGLDIRDIYNTRPEELDIIRRNFKVFRMKVDLSTRSQLVRSRANYQELSRRYVDGDKYPVTFLLTQDLEKSGVRTKGMNTEELYALMLEHYHSLLDSDVKPQSARRVLPQAMYTELWGGFTNSYFDNLKKLRLSKTAQTEISNLVGAMKELDDMSFSL